jgi:hypothetical protein
VTSPEGVVEGLEDNVALSAGIQYQLVDEVQRGSKLAQYALERRQVLTNT